MIIYGSFLIDKIRSNLMNNDLAFKQFLSFLPDVCDVLNRQKILGFLITIYSCMRGKDYCYKLLSKGSTLKFIPRQTRAILADPKHRIKKENKKERKKSGSNKENHK